MVNRRHAAPVRDDCAIRHGGECLCLGVVDSDLIITLALDQIGSSCRDARTLRSFVSGTSAPEFSMARSNADVSQHTPTMQ